MAALSADLAQQLVFGGDMPSNHAGFALAGPTAVYSTVAGSCIVCEVTKPVWLASTGELARSELHHVLTTTSWPRLGNRRRRMTGDDYVRLRQQKTLADERGLSEDVLR